MGGHRIVEIVEPSLCIGCRFMRIATVEMEGGKVRRMLNCKRLDCDNWQTVAAQEIPVQVTEEPKREG